MVELVPQEVDVAYEMVGIRQAIDLLEFQFSRLAATFDKGSYWEQEGSNSPIDWIRFNCHMTSNAAGAADRGRREPGSHGGEHPGHAGWRDRLHPPGRDGADGRCGGRGL